MKQGKCLKDIAVLYRVRAESKLLCNRLINEKIPFYTKEPPEDLHKGLVFNDIIAYYKLAHNLHDDSDLQRIINRPKRFIKQASLQHCKLDRNNIIQRM